MSKVIKKTANTYEAAYYLVNGAYLAGVVERKIALNKIDKYGYRFDWKMTMGNVPQRAIQDWRLGKASVNVRQYEAARRKLKKKIRKHLELEGQING